MKTIILLASMFISANLYASAYTSHLSNETGLAYSVNYDYDIDDFRDGDRLSAVVTYTSTTFSNVVFSTPAATIGSALISATAHGLTKALPVLYRVTAGTALGPLIGETTYYAIANTPNIFSLSTTSAQALANDPIVITSKANGDTETYTLIALPITGTPSFKFRVSNDGVDFADLSVSSATMLTYTAGGVTSIWDFAFFNYKFLRMAVIGPETGGILLKAVMNEKK